MRQKKSPQEKKRLSLEKDRRNSYGENDKASRKNIPRAKARVNRANRRLDSTALTEALGSVDETAEGQVEDKVKGRRPKAWRKWADEPLARQLARRKDGGNPGLSFDPSDKGSPYN